MDKYWLESALWWWDQARFCTQHQMVDEALRCLAKGLLSFTWALGYKESLECVE